MLNAMREDYTNNCGKLSLLHLFYSLHNWQVNSRDTPFILQSNLPGVLAHV